MAIKRGYGWRPQLPDRRDLRLSLATPANLPPSVDLRPKMPPVYDQGQLGSCTGNAVAAALQYARRAEGKPDDFAPSRLFIYYGERVLEHSVRSDAGAEIRDGFKVLAHTGAPPETLWPYDIAKFARKPPASAYRAAKLDIAVAYEAVPQDVAAMHGVLAAGYPIVVGFTVYQSFESAQVARTGVVPMPGPAEAVLGGHAVLVVGYDMAADTWLIRNSWGEGWGQGGYFTMPTAYLASPGLASDFWVLRTTS